MSRVIVLGGGICGLPTAMLLARDGHDVTVLERDPAPPPGSAEEAWDDWSRDGVGQFRQPHYLQPRGLAILDEELPEVRSALEACGAAPFDVLGLLPPSITDRARRPGDERFVTLGVRRPVLERVVGQLAEQAPGVDVRRGVGVDGLLTRVHDGTPHVTGVRAKGGAVLKADLVVDAMGRRSPMPRWLREAGAAPMHDESEDSGFIYYSRFFRAGDGGVPQPRGPLQTPLGSFSLVTLPGDADTWSVILYISAGDQPLKRLREPERWMAVIAACPAHAHWLDGEPITNVLPMAGVMDRFRRLSIDGRPVVTGLALAGDACACTNPSIGRGMTLGLLQAQCVRDAAREHADAPKAFADALDAATEARVAPWYRETVAEDRGRRDELEALRRGLDPPARGGLMSALIAALPHDADVFRAFLDSRCCYTPLGETLARPELAERVLELAATHAPRAFPAPSREQLLEIAA